MAYLLRTKGRLSYSIYTNFRRTFQLSSHGTNFEKFEDKSNNQFTSTINEGRSVKLKKLGKRTSRDEINERFQKLKERLQKEILEESVRFDGTESTKVHEVFESFSGDDDALQNTRKTEVNKMNNNSSIANWEKQEKESRRYS